MSAWIRNPEGRIIAIDKELSGRHLLKKRPGKIAGGIVLVATLVIVIAVIALWPSDDPAVLPSSAHSGAEDRLVAGVAGQVDGEEPLIALTADGAELWRPTLAVYSVDETGGLQRIAELDAPIDELRDDLPAAPGIAFADGIVYIPLAGTDRSALWIVDLSNPAAPRELATVALETTPGAVAVDSNLAAVGPMDGTIVRFFDISDLAQPQPVSEYRARVVSGVDLTFVENTLFASNRDGVTAVDVSRTGEPREIGSWSSDTWPRGNPPTVSPRVAASGDYLVAAADMWGVEVLGIGNPTEISRPTRSLGVTQIPGNFANVDDAVDVAVTANTAYVLWRGDVIDDNPVRWSYLIQEIDVTDPDDLQIVSETSDLAGYASFQSLVIGEDHLYFLNRDRIHVVNTAG